MEAEKSQNITDGGLHEGIKENSTRLIKHHFGHIEQVSMMHRKWVQIGIAVKQSDTYLFSRNNSSTPVWTLKR